MAEDLTLDESVYLLLLGPLRVDLVIAALYQVLSISYFDTLKQSVSLVRLYLWKNLNEMLTSSCSLLFELSAPVTVGKYTTSSLAISRGKSGLTRTHTLMHSLLRLVAFILLLLKGVILFSDMACYCMLGPPYVVSIFMICMLF